MSSKVPTIRVPSELKSKLEQPDKTLRRSKASTSQHMDEKAWLIEELTQAKKEIKQGKFISNDVVNQYLDSWGKQEVLKPKQS